VIGGSAGIGLEVARRARAEGANVILAGRDPQRRQYAASEIGALSTATFDANVRLPSSGSPEGQHEQHRSEE
jgi:NAD(P)-dependent dehydrogenase (short-subunit alcohol dehydrogenase family)